MIRLGLTGSIAMGKSTVAAMLAARGAALYDADAAVHRIYAPGGAAVAAVGALAPEAVGEGGVDRGALKARIAAEPGFLHRLEAVVHPILAEDRRRLVAEAETAGAALMVFDAPLLFETGMDREMDAIMVVSAPPEVQRARALARESVTEALLETILARQASDAEKRARADFVIDTGGDLAATEAQVDAMLASLLSPNEARPATDGPA